MRHAPLQIMFGCGAGSSSDLDLSLYPPSVRKFIMQIMPCYIMQVRSFVLTSDTPKVTVTRSSSDQDNSRVFTHITYPIKREKEVLKF